MEALYNGCDVLRAVWLHCTMDVVSCVWYGNFMPWMLCPRGGMEALCQGCHVM